MIYLRTALLILVLLVSAEAARAQSVDYLRESKQPLHSATLMSDGNRVYMPDSREAVIDLLAKGQGVFAIAIDRVAIDLEGSLAKAQRRSRPAARAGGG